MKRRNFLKKSLITGGALLLPPIFKKSEIKADHLINLNYKPDPATWSNNNLTLAWIGHSTVLINMFGKWIVTDPVLFDKIGLYFFIGGLPKGKDPKTSAPHHTPEFFIDDSAFKTGVIAFCNLVFDYMEMQKK